MNKTILFFSALFITACSSETPTEISHNAQSYQLGFFIKATHYFADAWPVTFWQEFELEKIEGDLDQIKNDGFNTVILVIPWKGFETGFEQRKTSSNKEMYKRLEFLLNKISQKDLHYMLRLGYAYNDTPAAGINPVALCTSQYNRSTPSKNWLRYLKKIHTITNKFNDNLIGVFVSWEDFWCPHDVFPELDLVRRKELAKSIGYTKWLKKQDPILFETSLGNIKLDPSKIAVPAKNDFSYLHYLHFIDLKFDTVILAPMKKIFSHASIEVRTDKARINRLVGEPKWMGYDLHFNELNHRGTYWAPFWGAKNEGEKLTAEEALHNFKYFLETISNKGESINHVLEQFNFFDNSPDFPNNANIIASETESFLFSSVPLLKKYSAGYGVWAYRDYVDNALYNASFEMGLKGWDAQGDVSIITEGQDQQLKMQADSVLSQTFEPHTKFMRLEEGYNLNLHFYASSKGKANVYVYDTLLASLAINEGENSFVLPVDPFKDSITIEFRLEAKTAITIDELRLSGFTQSLGLYDEFNQPGPYIDAIRKVNALLETPIE